MEVIYTKRFVKMYKKMPIEIQELFYKKESIFKNNIFDERLSTHKLHGLLSLYYSFYINYKYRVIFEILENKTIKFLFIGSHGVYDKID